MKMLHCARKASVRFRRGSHSLHFAVDAGNPDDAASPVPDRHLAIDNELVGTLPLGGRCDGIDDGDAGAHDLPVPLNVEVCPVLWVEVVLRLADGLPLRTHLAILVTTPIVHHETAAPVFHKESDIRQKIEKLAERLNALHFMQEVLSKHFRILARKIQTISTSIQAWF